MSTKVRAVDIRGTPVLLPAADKNQAEFEERLRTIIKQEIRDGSLALEHRIADLNAKLVKIDFRAQVMERAEREFERLYAAFRLTMANQLDLITAVNDMSVKVRNLHHHLEGKPNEDGVEAPEQPK